MVEIYPLQVWMPGVQNQGIGRAVLSPKPVEESSFQLPAEVVAGQPWHPWLVAASFQALPPSSHGHLFFSFVIIQLPSCV